MERKIPNKLVVIILLLPLLLFAVLLVPYSLINNAFIGDLFGCGCTPGFNANDFNLIFWFFIAVCVTAISAVLSIKLIPKDQLWLRIVYVVAILAVSIFIAWNFRQMMMWK